MSFVHLDGSGNVNWRGALRITQRQAPLLGEGLGECGRRMPDEARMGAFGVVQPNTRTPTLLIGARFFIDGTLDLADRFISMR